MQQLTSILLIAILINIGFTSPVPKNETNCEIEVLKSDIDRPYQLAVDYSTNTLFFSYSLNENDDDLISAYINLNTKEFSDIKKVNNGFSHAVDHKNNEVYIGGSDGLYKYHYKTKSAEHIGAKDVNIWNMFFKEILYYSVFPSQFLYIYANGESTRFQDLEDTKVDQFVIDNENIMFFTNDTGLFSQKKGTKDAVLYKEFPNNGIRGFATDVNGNAFTCLQDGIYKINKNDKTLDKIVDVDDAFGLAFDNENNLIYSDVSKVVRLNKEKVC